MATSTFRLRVGALAAAAGLVLAGVAAASPAAAADDPVISLDRTTFPAGDWEDGFRITGSGFDGTVPTAELSIGSMGENGGGQLWGTTVTVAADGTIDTVVVPSGATQVAGENGYPRYVVSVGQQITEGEPWLWSNRIDLTITEGASLSVAAELTPEQVAGGVTATFAGFTAGEAVYYGIGLFRDGELVDAIEDAVDADDSGAGTFGGALEGAQVGDYLQLYADGDTSGRVAEGWVQIVEAPAPAPVDPEAPAAGTPAAAEASGNQLAETGIDLGIGTAALALLVLGAGALIVVRRRSALAQR
ncbi:hypothetical protein FLP10_07890 [Agromyces intestinalis]|uniref:LPXTG cell wall anchor domain-containing protein n=1 Tax=Agromyces intestinalis TaxID=2592652 RepID=A0A5C1YF98_9MICO|nr:hypothetical protein [Agromyces intestinalis]QEO14348.1 hypothetical protein FLP10_07890 [Agromyces intestinalis]